MKRSFDIRAYKRRLRDRYKLIRREMAPGEKAKLDQKIFDRLCSLPEYQQCATVLTFVSTAIEVDTHKLIRKAIRQGKAVAVPYCVDGTRVMDFYRIRSLGELRPRTFGVMEPQPKVENRVTDFSESLCVLPGLAFDSRGYRLGYGGGYYDRFLSKVYQGGTTVGVCYSACTRPSLSRGRYDIPCDILVTDRGIKRFSKQGKRKSP